MKIGQKKNINISLSSGDLKSKLIEENKVIVEEQQEIAKRDKILFQSATKLKQHHQIIFLIIIATAVTMLFHGLWYIINNYWFPKLPSFSAISGIIIGIGILFFMREAISELNK